MGKFTLLLVDDVEENIYSLKMMIEDSFDVNIFSALSAQEGIKILVNENIDLILTDVQMPEIDGFETMEKIRSNSSVPILMFTSKNDNASKVRGLRGGADDYLTKPFDMDELIARVLSLIRRYTWFNPNNNVADLLFYQGLTIDVNSRSIKVEGKDVTCELPPKEFDLLYYLAKNQGKILTKKQIYEIGRAHV